MYRCRILEFDAFGQPSWSEATNGYVAGEELISPRIDLFLPNTRLFERKLQESCRFSRIMTEADE